MKALTIILTNKEYKQLKILKKQQDKWIKNNMCIDDEQKYFIHIVDLGLMLSSALDRIEIDPQK